MFKIKITPKQFENILLREQEKRSNIIIENTKEILLGVAMLMNLGLSGLNKIMGQEAISNKETLIKIKKILEDENKLQDLVKALEEKGMTNPDIKLANKAELIKSNFNDAAKKINLNQTADSKLTINLINLDKNLAKTHGLVDEKEINEEPKKTLYFNVTDELELKLNNDKIFSDDEVSFKGNVRKMVEDIFSTIKDLNGTIISSEIELSSDSDITPNFITDYDESGNIELLEKRSEYIINLINGFNEDIQIKHRNIPNNGFNIVSTKEFSSSAKKSVLKAKTADFRYTKIKLIFNTKQKNSNNIKIGDVLKNNRKKLMKCINGEPKSYLLDDIFKTTQVNCKTKSNENKDVILFNCSTI